MDVLITLTNVGADQGSLFDLYSDVDGYTVAFDTDVSLASLLATYTASVPVGTTIVRVVGQSTCENILDITIVYTTTTTSTLGPV